MSIASTPPARSVREQALLQSSLHQAHARIDRLFGWLMIAQYVAGLGLAFVASPRTWAGAESAPHLHVYAALLFGAAAMLVPAVLAFRRAGAPSTRLVVAAGQMLTASLFIHLTAGRIETHFHIFASLGILALYQDWRVVITASVVTAVDHLFRGLFWPESVFGVMTMAPWRIAEHAWWVVFSAVFLVKGAVDAVKERRVAVRQQAEAEAASEANERLRGAAEEQRAELERQQQALEETMRVAAAERTALDEGVALMLRQMEAFADGDLSVRLPDDGDGALGRLFRGFNAAVARLDETISTVDDVVRETTASAGQIRTSTEALAAGAQEQSMQSQEVAGAIEEMTSTVIENARNASRSSELASQNGSRAEAGGRVVAQTVEKIQRIAEVVRSSAGTIEQLGRSSDRIGEIVSVISDIADQTNLLALNAAIEAARAGDQGRGFAVVADEVRKLAERTTGATQEIAGMITSIQADTGAAVQSMQKGTREVEEGLALADQAGAALDEIVQGGRSMADLIALIATASEQQSTTSEEISRSVEAISAVSAESADGITQIARVADALSRNTDRLDELLRGFHTGAGTARPAGHTAAPSGDGAAQRFAPTF